MIRIAKRMAACLAVALLAPAAGGASDLAVKIGAGFFYPLDESFQDVYGGGVKYGLELRTVFSRHLELWVEAGLFSKKGEFSITKEETRLRIIPLGGGMSYVVSPGRWNFSAGLGLNYFLFHESNFVGTVDSGKLGLVGRLVISRRLGKKIHLTGHLRYSRCDMEPREFRFNVGGFEAGIGAVYEF
jgi:hypothetical protein